MSNRIETVIATPIRECFGPDSPHEWVATRILGALKAARIAVVELPEPSEWIDGQPHWNDYPFVRLTPGADDEIALGATCEHLYGINRHEARNVAADLLAAADAAEAQR